MELKNISYFVIITLNNYVKMSPTDKRLCKGINYLSDFFSRPFKPNRCQHPLQPKRRHLPRQIRVTRTTSSPTNFDRPRASFFVTFFYESFSRFITVQILLIPTIFLKKYYPKNKIIVNF